MEIRVLGLEAQDGCQPRRHTHHRCGGATREEEPEAASVKMSAPSSIPGGLCAHAVERQFSWSDVAGPRTLRRSASKHAVAAAYFQRRMDHAPTRYCLHNRV